MFVGYFNIIPSIKSYSKMQVLLKNLFSYICAPLDRHLKKSGENATVSFMPLKGKEIKNYRNLMILVVWNRKYKLMESSVKYFTIGLVFGCPQHTQLFSPLKTLWFPLIPILLMTLVEGINVITYWYFSPPVRHGRDHVHFPDLPSARFSSK